MQIRVQWATKFSENLKFLFSIDLLLLSKSCFSYTIEYISVFSLSFFTLFWIGSHVISLQCQKCSLCVNKAFLSKYILSRSFHTFSHIKIVEWQITVYNVFLQLMTSEESYIWSKYTQLKENEQKNVRCYSPTVESTINNTEGQNLLQQNNFCQKHGFYLIKE